MDFFQKLSIEETLRRVGLVFSRKYAVWLSITVLAYLLFFAASVLAIFMLAPFVDYANGNGMSDPHTVVAHMIDNAIYFAVMCIADGAIVRSVAEMYVGQVPTVDGTLQHGLSKAFSLIGNAVTVGAAVGIPGFLVLLFMVWVSDGSQSAVMAFNVIFVIVAVAVIVVTYHTYPIIMVENAGIVDSIKRSYDLSKGHRVHILTLLLIFNVVKYALFFVFSLIATNTGGAGGAIMALFKLIVSVVFASLGSM
jgi:hypothetical protein